MLKRWLYRSRQFFLASGRVTRKDMAEARRVLGPRLYPLFAAMPRQYRLHSLNVYRRVREAGCDDLSTWQAALLHDSGKFDPTSGCYVTIAHRVMVVLLGSSASGRRLLKWLSRPVERIPPRLSLNYLRYPFYLSEHHPVLGSVLAGRHGAAEGVVELIRDHHIYQGQSVALKALQAADSKS